MQGIEKITSRIRSDAEREGGDILAKARAEAETLAAEYRRKASVLSAELLEKSEKSAADSESRLVSAARMEARKRQLAVRQELLDEAFASTLTQLVSKPSGERQNLYETLLTKLSPKGTETIVLNAADSAAFGKELAARFHVTLDSQTHTGAGGFLLTEGAVTVNSTYETILRELREELAGEIAAILFN